MRGLGVRYEWKVGRFEKSCIAVWICRGEESVAKWLAAAWLSRARFPNLPKMRPKNEAGGRPGSQAVRRHSGRDADRTSGGLSFPGGRMRDASRHQDCSERKPVLGRVACTVCQVRSEIHKFVHAAFGSIRIFLAVVVLGSLSSSTPSLRLADAFSGSISAGRSRERKNWLERRSE